MNIQHLLDCENWQKRIFCHKHSDHNLANIFNHFLIQFGVDFENRAAGDSEQSPSTLYLLSGISQPNLGSVFSMQILKFIFDFRGMRSDESYEFAI